MGREETAEPFFLQVDAIHTSEGDWRVSLWVGSGRALWWLVVLVVYFLLWSWVMIWLLRR